eukprot:m.337485 g.337485  ORF g.337485 m.337485 type:complete len:370 (+) comp18146_c0_seq1:246-1355(+)
MMASVKDINTSDNLNIGYSDDYSAADLRLLELPSEVAEALESGLLKDGDLCLKGGDSDTLVCCTPEKTYGVRVADTSNTLLVTRSEGSDYIIEGTVGEHLELQICPPRVEKLKELLGKPYDGPQLESEIGQIDGLKSFEDLLAIVQASEKELKEALRKINAFELDGFWRILSEKYLSEKFELILNCAVAEDWKLTELSVNVISESLKSHDMTPTTVRCLLHMFGSAIDMTESNDIFSLDEKKVCQFAAEQLFKMQDNWPAETFIETWKEKIPDGMTSNEEYLEGLCLKSDSGALGGGQEYSYYPSSVLPKEVKKRMRLLFQKEASWTLSDITPYVRELTPPGSTVDKLLFKHARIYTDSNTGLKMVNKK